MDVRCTMCRNTKADLVHPENWGDHQKKVMAEDPEIAKMMNNLAHPYTPIPEDERCGDCEGTGIYLLPDDQEQHCGECDGTGRR